VLGERDHGVGGPAAADGCSTRAPWSSIAFPLSGGEPMPAGVSRAGPQQEENGQVADQDPTAGGRAAAGFRPEHGLAALGAFAAFGIGLSVLYATTGAGVPCPFRAVTGWQCPLCGGTRLGAALLHGDVSAAWSANPVVLVGLIVLTVLGIGWSVELLGGPAIRLPQRLRRVVAEVRPTTWLVAVPVSAALFVLLRNLPQP